MKQNNCVCSQNNKKNEITPLSAIETKKKNIFNKFWRKTKQWPLAPNSRDSLITRANVSRQVTFFSKMAFGECQRVWRVWAKQVGESGESEQTRLANIGESGKSDPFSKRVFLASIRIRQKWRISGEYSNSINSLSSGHCLRKHYVYSMKSIYQSVYILLLYKH